MIQLLEEPRRRLAPWEPLGRAWIERHGDLTQALSAYDAIFQELYQQELT